MANLLDSIPHQLIEDSDPKFWAEIALPLVRKVFADIEEKKRRDDKMYKNESLE